MVDPMFLHFFLPMNKKNSPYNCSHMVSTFWLVKPPASPLSTGLGTYWELSTNNVLVIFPPTIFMLKNLRLGCVEWLSIVLGIVREFYYQTPPPTSSCVFVLCKDTNFALWTIHFMRSLLIRFNQSSSHNKEGIAKCQSISKLLLWKQEPRRRKEKMKKIKCFKCL